MDNYDFLDDGEDVVQSAAPSLDDLKQADYGNLGLDVDESSVSNDDLLFADDNNDSLDANILAGNVENKPKVDDGLDLGFDSLDVEVEPAEPASKPSISKPEKSVSKPETPKNSVQQQSSVNTVDNATEYSDADYSEFNSLDDISDTPVEAKPESSVESRAKHKKPASTSKKTTTTTTTRKTTPTVTDSRGQENSIVDLKLVRKVATILEVLNSLSDSDKKIVKSFLSTISQISMAEKVDNTDASMVVSILSLDPTVKNGVLTLMKAKSLAGASRAFYLMGLKSEQFNNMALILQLVQALAKPLTVSDTMDSIRKAAQTVDECLNLRFTGKSVEFLTPVKLVLEKVEKVSK
jgi:hypothetical protein